MSQPLANRLAEYASQLRFEDLPAEAIHETKRRVIDSFATAVGAMDAEAYGVAQRCALRVRSSPGASVLGGGKSSIEWATSSTACSFATSITTIPTSPRTRTPATTWRRAFRR